MQTERITAYSGIDSLWDVGGTVQNLWDVLKELWEYMKYLMGCLGEGSKARKERDQDGLERKKHGESENKELKGWI